MLGISSCQKDDDSILKHKSAVSNSNTKYKISKVAYETIQQNTRLVSSLTNINGKGKSNNSGSQNRIVHSTAYDFYIDTDIATYMESDDESYHSYTFPIYRDNPTVALENILFSLQPNGEYKVSLVTYDITESEKENLYNGGFIDLTNKIIIVDIDGADLIDDIFNRAAIGCADFVLTYCNCSPNHPGGYFENGNPCDCYNIQIYTVCSGGGGGTNGPDNSDVPDGENNTGGGNPDNPNNSNNDATTPVITIPYEQNVIQCLGLDDVENANFLVTNWINNPANFTQVRNMSSFLNNKNCSDKAQIFVLSSIEAILNDELEEFDEDFYTWGVTKDDTFVNSELDCIYEKLKGGNLGNNFFKDMLFEFDQLTPLKFSIGPTPNSDYAFTKGETTTVFGQTHASYEIISNQTTEEASNLKKIVSLSHELIHAFMYKSLEEFGIIEFDNEGFPTAEVSAICNDFQIIPNVNLNTYTVKDRWIYLICEFNENNPGNQQWTHSLFNSSVFAVETYREKLEQILIDNHDWESEPSSLQNLAINQFGPNWINEVAEYMSWLGLHATPEFEDWLIEKDITYNYWNNSIGPWNNSDWVVNNDVLHNCE